jgi:PTH2 family peptidyl-tRNA hydrolase
LNLFLFELLNEKGNNMMYQSKMMIVMRRDLKMRKGKIAAQAGHACIEAILMALSKEERMDEFEITADGLALKNTDKPSSPLFDWFMYGCAKVCVYVDSEEALLDVAKKAEEREIIASVVTDAGMTEFHGIPTKTCLALEPLPADIADELTGTLPLY